MQKNKKTTTKNDKALRDIRIIQSAVILAMVLMSAISIYGIIT